MGIIKNMIARAGTKAADKVARLSVLSPEQLNTVQQKRDAYLSEIPTMDNEAAVELTSRLLAASSVEVFNEYLQHIHDMYVPVQHNAEYGVDFRAGYNIRFFEITKWVASRKENTLEKLVSTYQVLSNEPCNIALVFHRSCTKTSVYLAVSNTQNADDNVDIEQYKTRLMDAIKGNFPGSELSQRAGVGVLPCLNNNTPFSVACASNIPGEKSEKFISQTIEKLLDGVVPESPEKEYIVVLLATPINDIENRKIHLTELYSALAPYAGWETNFTFTQADSVNSSATFGVNVGASAGIQQGQSQANTVSTGTTDNTSTTETDSSSRGKTNTEGSSTTDTTGETSTASRSVSEGGSNTKTESLSRGHSSGSSTNQSHTEGSSTNVSHTKAENSNQGVNVFSVYNNSGGSSVSDLTGTGSSLSETVGSSLNTSNTSTSARSTATSSSFNNTATEALAKNVAQSLAKNVSKAVTNNVGRSIANTLGKAVTNTVGATSGIYKGVNLGANIGASFARASNITATVGKNEGIVQHFTNYNIKHLLENLEMQMKRCEQSNALGMWDFAAYVLSEDQNVANNVAYSYLALTQGEQSYLSQKAVNLWRGDMGKDSDDAKEICSYIKELRHPIFALNPNLIEAVPISNVYPAVISPTTSLSGKELAYSLNFPQKSIAGMPVIQCAEFARDVVTYDLEKQDNQAIIIGNIFHMNRIEPTCANISLQSLASHVFITGSTGSGKSNTVYKIIDEATANNVKFMVIEPSKGEYKHVFGALPDVSVFGTNPSLSPLLRLNPFSFPSGIHIYEHMDRLVEIFNVCWPMYAAMPAVLKHAIEKSYEDCGWDLVQSTNQYSNYYYPTFSDVARNIKAIIDSSEYDTENKGAYKGSLLTRLQSLSNGINGLVFSSNELPANVLFDENVVIDLSRVGSTETKSLLMGMLVLKLQEYRLSTAKEGNAPLRHITVLEEAHCILRKTSAEQPVEGGNLAGKSVEMLSNAIAEMRTYGEGFIIVDQAPGLLDLSVIRNTNTKVILRLPDQGDRELVGRAANLNDDQIIELAKLPCGVAAVYQNEWVQPILCKVDKVASAKKHYTYSSQNATIEAAPIEDRLEIAALLSKGVAIDNEVQMAATIGRLERLLLPASTKVSIIKMLSEPPYEPNMTKLAPIMKSMFPEISKKIEKSFSNESDVTRWTRDANELLLKYNIDGQVRRDIIQGTITNYLLYETNNRSSLEKWIQQGGLR